MLIILGVTIVCFLITIFSGVLDNAGMAALIIIWIPVLIGLATIILYWLIRFFAKSKSYWATIVGCSINILWCLATIFQ